MKKMLSALAAIFLLFSFALSEGAYLYPAKGDNGLYGYIDETGAWAIAPAFSFAGKFRGNFAEAALPDAADTASGIIDKTGAFVLAPEYLIDSGYDGGYYGGRDTGIFYVSNDSGAGFFDIPSGCFSGIKWSAVFPWIDETDTTSGALVPVMTMDGAGYAERGTGKEIIPCKYESADPNRFFEGRCVTGTEDENGAVDKYVLLDQTGASIPIPENAALKHYSRMSCGRLIYQDTATGLLGYLNADGQIAVPAVYADAVEFSEGYAVVQLKEDAQTKEGVAAVIDKDGTVVYKGFMPDDGIELTLCKNGYIAFLQGGTVRILDPKTGVCTAADIENADNVFDVMDNGLMWFSRVQDGELYFGLLSANGSVVHPADLMLDEFSPLLFHSGLHAVNADGKFGYVDETGRMAIPAQYDEADEFYGPLALVIKSGGETGYIDRTGAEVFFWR